MVSPAASLFLWATTYSTAFADAAAPATTTPAPPMGLGNAYLFGFAGGVVIFGALLAVTLRKEHLARNGQ